MRKLTSDKIMNFFSGKGFYIVLFLCAAAIGISGYFLLFANDETDPAAPDYSLSEPDNASEVRGNTTLTIPATPSAVAPTVAAEPTAAPSSGKTALDVTPAVIVWPLRGEVAAAFSTTELLYDETMGDWRTHGGIDIAAALGTQVCAASGGTVENVFKDDMMGTTVVVNHGNGVKTVYSNLQETPTVKKSDKVSAGDVIGAVGSTAIAESAQKPHLHFEVRKDDVAVNPTGFLPKQK